MNELLEISKNILRKNTICPEGWYNCVNKSFGLEMRIEVFFFKKDETLLVNVFLRSSNQVIFNDRVIKDIKYSMKQIDCNDIREIIFDKKLKKGLEGSFVSRFNCSYNTQTNDLLGEITMKIPLIYDVNMESIMKSVKEPLGAY